MVSVGGHRISTTKRTVTISITPAVTLTVESLAPAAPPDDFAAAAETAIARVLHHVEAEITAIDVGGNIQVRWSSALGEVECAGRTVPLLEQGRVGEAALLIEILSSADPENVTLLNNLGMVYSDQGFVDEAIALLERVVRIQPSHADAFVVLAGACTRRTLSGGLGEKSSCFRHFLTVFSSMKRLRAILAIDRSRAISLISCTWDMLSTVSLPPPSLVVLRRRVVVTKEQCLNCPCYSLGFSREFFTVTWGCGQKLGLL